MDVDHLLQTDSHLQSAICNMLAWAKQLAAPFATAIDVEWAQSLSFLYTVLSQCALRLLCVSQAAASNPCSKQGSAIAAWQLGDSKRLWYKLTKPLSVKYAEADQALDLKITYVSDTEYQVTLAGMCSVPRSV